MLNKNYIPKITLFDWLVIFKLSVCKNFISILRFDRNCITIFWKLNYLRLREEMKFIQSLRDEIAKCGFRKPLLFSP